MTTRETLAELDMLDKLHAEGGSFSWDDEIFTKWPGLSAALREMAEEREKLRATINAARTALEEIVCTKHPDDGVILKSDDSTCHYDPELKMQVYDHAHFSPLGDALIELHNLLTQENSHAGNPRDARQPDAS